TSRPFLSTTVAVTQIASVLVLNVVCCADARAAGPWDMSAAAATAASAPNRRSLSADVFMARREIRPARTDRLPRPGHPDVDAVQLAIERRRREPEHVLPMQFIRDALHRRLHIVGRLELEIPAAGRPGDCAELACVESLSSPDADAVDDHAFAHESCACRV